MDDRELIQKIAAQDHLAFRVLVDRYQALVLRTCLNFLRHRQNAEDVAQEVFLQVYKAAKQFRHECRLSTWIYRIAVRRSLNFIRDNKKSSWLASLSQFPENGRREEQALWAADTGDPESRLKTAELRKIIQLAVASLPGRQRAMFILDKEEGCSYQEIAAILEISVSSVEAGLHRAKINLQKKLASHFKKADRRRKFHRLPRV
jgi:RNA polymerase sigma-70 factor (ECF subfamily)